MAIWQIYLSGLALITFSMSVLWLASVRLRNASIVDIFWGLEFVLTSGLYALLSSGVPARNLLLFALVAAWGLRLNGYIFWRNRGHGEDKRYQQWRQQAGAKFWWFSFISVFMLQGVILWLVSSTLLIGQTSASPPALTVLDALGALVWLVGFGCEAIGDWQLARFKANPANKGRVMNRGLWRYTRHPNYFGEATLWWGYALIALNAPNGWLALGGALLMTVLLLRVSGVTLLEKDLVTSKPGYADYIRSTSAFVPLPPKK